MHACAITSKIIRGSRNGALHPLFAPQARTASTHRIRTARMHRTHTSPQAKPGDFFGQSCAPRPWLCPVLPYVGSRNPFVMGQLSNLGQSGSRLRDAFSMISGSGALWIFFAGDFQRGSALSRTDFNCPQRVLDDPQRRHGHPMGQKKITPEVYDLAAGPLHMH